MASYQTLQSSFAYGEISPRLVGRSNTDRYRESLRVCENCFTFSHGNAVKRSGSKYLEKSPSDSNVRLFPLSLNITTPYVVELGHNQAVGGYARVLDEDGYVTQGKQILDNPTFTDGLNGWDDVSSGDASVEWNEPGVARFIPLRGDAQLQQSATTDTPGQLHRVETNTLSNADDPAFTLNIGTTQGGSDIASLQLTNGGLESNTFTPPVATFWFTFIVGGAAGVADNFLEFCYAYDDDQVTFEAATPFTPEEIESINWVASFSGQLFMEFVVETKPPQSIFLDANDNWNWQQRPFASQPAAWGPDNYPRTVAIHQQRLWYGGTPQQPDTLWGSQTGNFSIYLPGSNPTDPIEFELFGSGNITWLSGARDLLMGLDDAEYIIESDGVAIAPGDIAARQQSAYGGAVQTAPKANNGVLFLGNDRRRIRFQNYQFLEDGWVSLDITWPSEHITAPLVQEMAFVYAPDPIIWLTMRDGSLVTAVYEREQNNLVGWHRQNFTNGELLSGAAVKLGADVEFYMAVRREIAGSEAIYIERIGTTDVGQQLRKDAPNVQSANVGDIFSPRCDSAVQRAVQFDAGTGEYFIDQLDHLEGQDVQVVIEGAMHIDRTVNLGRVNLQPGFDGGLNALSVVGLPYTGIMRTLPLEGGNQGGTSLHLRKHRNRIFLRLLDSTLPIVNNVTTGARFPITPMNEAEPLFTGDLQVDNLGWDRFAEVEILMPLAKPYNVLSIFGDAEVNRL